ncbi:HlyC/CorC family transporter [bacterium]|nr:HlyC/CorC family transporter [candidate division CSSED10-310 bacterium]
MSDLLVFSLLLTALAGSIFFSGSETGILSISEPEIKSMADKGSRKAKRLVKLLARKDLLLGTLLVGNNLSNVTLSALMTAYLADHNLKEWGPQISTLIVTPLILVFAEITPKAVYLLNGTPLLMTSVYILSFFSWIFAPITRIVVFVPKILSVRKSRTGKPLGFSREELRYLLRTGTTQKIMTHEEQRIISRLLDFSTKKVAAAMVPMGDVACISDDTSLFNAVELFHRHGFSRLPVYLENPENIIGVLFAIDVLNIEDPQLPIVELMRQPHIVPEQKKATELLPDIWDQHEMSIVVDEYGVAVGIITAEDLLEEIMGEIEDEYDRLEHKQIMPLVEGVFIVDAGISISEFNSQLVNLIPRGHYITLAGFIATYLQRIPKIREKFMVKDAEITVLEATPKRILKILLRLPNMPGKNYKHA